MNTVIVGGGLAGLTAAVSLARRDLPVTVLESGRHCGAENWGGCVLFGRHLAQPDVLGRSLDEDAPWQRRITRRGVFWDDEGSTAGFEYAQNDPFRHCYTVFRPGFDRWMADRARRAGATILTGTTARSLVYEDQRVIGVQTDRGILYADLVFLAEGGASRLLEREEYIPHSGRSPRWQLGMKEVLPLPEERINDLFELESSVRGSAWEWILTEPPFGGAFADRAARGFLYTQRNALSLGLSLPLQASGNPPTETARSLMDRFRQRPFVQRMSGGREPTHFGSKLLRIPGGGVRSPLCDHGLAVGGAAAGGTRTVPYINGSGPATFTGRALARAVTKIHRRGGEPDRQQLTSSYERAVKRDSSTEPNGGSDQIGPRGETSAETVARVALTGLKTLEELSTEDRSWAGSVLSQARVIRRYLLDSPGPVDAVRLLRRLGLLGPLTRALWPFGGRNANRQKKPPPGIVRFLGSTRDQTAPGDPRHGGNQGAPSRLNAGLARAAALLFRNDERSIPTSLREAAGKLARSLRGEGTWSLLGAGVLALLTWPFHGVIERLRGSTASPTPTPEGDPAGDQRDDSPPPARPDPAVRTDTDRDTPVRLRLPPTLRRNEDPAALPSRICPTGVFQSRADKSGRPVIRLRPERCLKCGACWRVSRCVDGHPAFGHTVTYTDPGSSEPPSVRHLVEGTSSPPLTLEPPRSAREPDRESVSAENGISAGDRDTLAGHLRQFQDLIERWADGSANGAGFHTDGEIRWNRTEANLCQRWLDTIKNHLRETGRVRFTPLPSNRLAKRLKDVESTLVHAHRQIGENQLSYARDLADQIRSHHLPVIRELLGIDPGAGVPFPIYRKMESRREKTDRRRSELRKRLAEAFPLDRIRQLEGSNQPPAEDLRKLGELVQPRRSPGWIKPRLEELGRVDLGLGVLVAQQYISAEILGDLEDAPGSGESALPYPGLCFEAEAGTERWNRSCLIGTGELIGFDGERFHRTRKPSPQQPAGGPGLRSLPLFDVNPGRTRELGSLPGPENRPRLELAARISHHLLPVMLGAGDRMFERAHQHARHRIQYPDRHRDPRGSDGLGKFGAVGQRLARVDLNRFLLETLSYFPAATTADESHDLAPVFAYLVGVDRLGPGPGSIAHEAGQIFGAWAISDEDRPAKLYRDSTTLPRYPLNTFELYRSIGSLPANHRWVGEVFGLNETEQRLWQQADELGVLSEPVRQWRGLIGDYRSLGEPDRHIDAQYRGRLLSRLWVGRRLIDRVQARLVSPKPCRKHVQLTRLYFRQLLRDWQRTESRLERADRLDDPGRRLEEYLEVTTGASPTSPPDVPPEDPGDDETGESIDGDQANYAGVCERRSRRGKPASSLGLVVREEMFRRPLRTALSRRLPRAQKQLDETPGNGPRREELRARLEELPDRIDTWDHRERSRFDALLGELETRIKRRSTSAELFSKELEVISRIRRYLRDNKYKKARELLGEIPPGSRDLEQRVPRLRAELDRRVQTLRRVLDETTNNAGGSPAWTEPAAGSDRTSVRTRARLRSRRLHPDRAGTYRFYPEGKNQGPSRRLLDAGRIVRSGEAAHYRGEEDQHRIRFDGSTISGSRSPTRGVLETPGDPLRFHDVAEVRVDHRQRPQYRFFRLDGAKTWVTGGGRSRWLLVLAEEPLGRTLLLVPSASEGVRRDGVETPMGLREGRFARLFFSGVRVPLENVVGLRGEGDSLIEPDGSPPIAGRAAMAAGMVHRHLEAAASRYTTRLERHHLCRLAEDHHLLSMLSRAGGEPSREDGEISPVSRARLVELQTTETILSSPRVLGFATTPGAENNQPLSGSFRLNARVLSLFPNPEEPVRWELVKRWLRAGFPALREPSPAKTDDRPEDELLDTIRDHARRLDEMVENDPGAFPRLQPVLFKFTRVVQRYFTRRLLGGCTAAHNGTETEQPPPRGWLNRSLINRLEAEIELGNRELEHELAELDDGRDPPSLRVADCLLKPPDDPRNPPGIPGEQTLPSRSPAEPRTISVITHRVPVLSPHPVLHDGSPSEPSREWDPSGGGALSLARRLKRADPRRVGLRVHVVGPAEDLEVGREILAAGADQVQWIEASDPARVDPTGADPTLPSLRGSDLVLLDQHRSDRPWPHRHALISGRLNRPLYRGVRNAAWSDGQLTIQRRHRGDHAREVTLPACLAVDRPAPASPDWDLSAMNRALTRDLELVDGPDPRTGEDLRVRGMGSAGPAKLAPDEVAERIRNWLRPAAFEEEPPGEHSEGSNRPFSRFGTSPENLLVIPSRGDRPRLRDLKVLSGPLAMRPEANWSGLYVNRSRPVSRGGRETILEGLPVDQLIVTRPTLPSGEARCTRSSFEHILGRLTPARVFTIEPSTVPVTQAAAAAFPETARSYAGVGQLRAGAEPPLRKSCFGGRLQRRARWPEAEGTSVVGLTPATRVPEPPDRGVEPNVYEMELETPATPPADGGEPPGGVESDVRIVLGRGIPSHSHYRRWIPPLVQHLEDCAGAAVTLQGTPGLREQVPSLRQRLNPLHVPPVPPLLLLAVGTEPDRRLERMRDSRTLFVQLPDRSRSGAEESRDEPPSPAIRIEGDLHQTLPRLLEAFG